MSRVQITFQNWNISSTFEISSKVYVRNLTWDSQSRRRLWHKECFYDVNHFFHSFTTSNISRTEKHTEIIISLLECWILLEYSCLLAHIFNKSQIFFPRYQKMSQAVGSSLMSRVQISFQNRNISWTFWDIVQSVRKKFNIKYAEKASFMT